MKLTYTKEEGWRERREGRKKKKKTPQTDGKRRKTPSPYNASISGKAALNFVIFSLSRLAKLLGEDAKV